MEKLILQTLTTYKPMSTRMLMKICKVSTTAKVGVLTEVEYDFVSLLNAMQNAGRIALIEGKGWVRV